MVDTKSLALTILWKIKKFSCCMSEPGYVLNSPSFASQALNSNLKLVFTPKTENGCIRIQLQSVDKKFEKVFASFEYSLLTSDGSVVLRKYDHAGFMDVFPPTVLEFVEIEAIFGKEKESFLSGDTLTVRFKLWTNDANNQLNEYLLNTINVAHQRKFAWDLLKFDTSNVFNEVLENFSIPMKVTTKVILVNSTFEPRIQINVEHIKVIQNLTTGACAAKIKHDPIIVICQVIIQDSQGKVYFTSRSSLPLCHQVGYTCSKYSWNFPAITIPRQCLGKKGYIFRCELGVSQGLYTSELVDILPLSYNNATINCQAMRQSVSQFNEKTNELACISLKEGLQYLYGEKKVCDVTLCVGSTTVGAHRTVLCAMSPVFTAMFEHDTKESKEGVVNIVDIKEETLKRMLSYLYCYDLTQDIKWEEMLELYFAADKYEIEPLKKTCTSHLLSNISNTNACAILVLADTHQDKELMLKLQDFILEKFDEILGSNTWESLESNHPHLTTKILRRAYSKKINV